MVGSELINQPMYRYVTCMSGSVFRTFYLSRFAERPLHFAPTNRNIWREFCSDLDHLRSHSAENHMQVCFRIRISNQIISAREKELDVVATILPQRILQF